MAGSIGFNTNGTFQVNGTERLFGSQLLAYHLLSGQLSLQNSVTDTGFATTLYTGTGASLPVATGIDGATQWGNLTTEKLGAMYWVKSRSVATTSNMVYDTVRGDNNHILTDGTAAQSVGTYPFAITSTGFTVNTTSTNLDGSGATYVAWGFQTTHRITGTTNHGQAFTCHYNPFTGFTMVQYTGSGIAGHEIPHMLGRKLGFFTHKNLSNIADWQTHGSNFQRLVLNLTNADGNDLATYNVVSNDISVVIGGSAATNAGWNASANTYIMYGWANSYFDVQNNLIGNYEIGTYQGTGAAGNKVSTRGKPTWVMIKRLDSTSNWIIIDNKRTANGRLYPNGSAAEDATILVSNFLSDGFTVEGNYEWNIAGGQYLYMVVYDNDSGSGKSKYPRATDTSNLNLNAVIPFANGVDASGVKNTTLTKNETVSGLALTYGKNYIYCTNTGTYGVSSHAPKYGNYYNGFGDYFDVKSNTWYQSPSIFSDLMNATTNWTAGELTGGAVATISSVNGELKLVNSGATYGAATSGITTVVGKKYRFIVTCTSTSGTVGIRVGTTAFGFELYAVPTFIGAGIQTVDFVATATTTYITISNNNTVSGAISTWDNAAVWIINNDGSVALSGATTITASRNYLDAIVYADNGAVPQPTFIEQLPKTRYEDVVRANEFQGKNACTGWAYIDGTTTPPTIKDSYNISAVIRTSTGIYDLYFTKPMDNVNYCAIPNGQTASSNIGPASYSGQYQLNKCSIYHVENNVMTNTWLLVQIFGGKN